VILAHRSLLAVTLVCCAGGGSGGGGGAVTAPSSSGASSASSTAPVVEAGAAAATDAQAALQQRCQVQCVGSGDGTRLQMEPKTKYRFELVKSDTSGKANELHVLSVQYNNNIMLVERSSPGDAFTMENDTLKVCSKLRGTGGGCAWSCAYDLDKQVVRVFTDQLEATFRYSCTP